MLWKPPPQNLFCYCLQAKVEDVFFIIIILYDPTIIDGLNELNTQLDLGKLTHKKAVVLDTLKEAFETLTQMYFPVFLIGQGLQRAPGMHLCSGYQAHCVLLLLLLLFFLKVSKLSYQNNEGKVAALRQPAFSALDPPCPSPPSSAVVLTQDRISIRGLLFMN